MKHAPATPAGGDRPACAFCRSDVADRAEQDRQRRRAQLDAFDLDVLGLIDRAEIQAAAAMVRVAREGVR